MSRISLANQQVDTLATTLDTPVAVAVSNSSLVWSESGSLTTYAGPNNTSYDAGTLGRLMHAVLRHHRPESEVATTMVLEGVVMVGAIAREQVPFCAVVTF